MEREESPSEGLFGPSTFRASTKAATEEGQTGESNRFTPPLATPSWPPEGEPKVAGSPSAATTHPVHGSLFGPPKRASWKTLLQRLLTGNDVFVLCLTLFIVVQPFFVWELQPPTELISFGLQCAAVAGLGIPLFHLQQRWRRTYVEEVVAIANAGFQLTSYGLFNTVQHTQFIDLTVLRSLLIHDGYFRLQAIFFLSASVENTAERLVLFPQTLPRLEVLIPVLRGMRAVLFGEPEFGPSLAQIEAHLMDEVAPAAPRGKAVGFQRDVSASGSPATEGPRNTASHSFSSVSSLYFTPSSSEGDEGEDDSSTN